MSNSSFKTYLLIEYCIALSLQQLRKEYFGLKFSSIQGIDMIW